MMIERVGLIVIILISIGSYLYATRRMAKLQKDYHYDERWQYLKLRAGAVAKTYYEALIIIIAILMILSLWTPTPMLVPLDRMLGIGALVIIGGPIIEFCEITRFDRTL